MQNSIRNLPVFEAQIQDNPLELLDRVENLMDVPIQEVYPTLVLM